MSSMSSPAGEATRKAESALPSPSTSTICLGFAPGGTAGAPVRHGPEAGAAGAVVGGADVVGETMVVDVDEVVVLDVDAVGRCIVVVALSVVDEQAASMAAMVRLSA